MSGRIATQDRTTLETTVHVSINLDGQGKAEIETGVPFLDHMLRHVSVHSLIDMEVRAKGDLEVDAHHTIEDVASVLGTALDQALGQKRAVNRIGSSFVPMDDALALVVIDLSGRGYAVVDAQFSVPAIGTMPTSLISHFFETFSVNGRMNLHARALYGRDDHHKAEAMFKALGRALGQAVAVDPKRQIISTKGILA